RDTPRSGTRVMIRIFKILLSALLLAGTFGTANAQSGPWVVSEVSGRVTVGGEGAQAISRGQAIQPGAVIETGRGARVVIVRGKDFVTVAPNSRIRVPAAQARGGGLFDLPTNGATRFFRSRRRLTPISAWGRHIWL